MKRIRQLEDKYRKKLELADSIKSPIYKEICADLQILEPFSNWEKSVIRIALGAYKDNTSIDTIKETCETLINKLK